MKEIEFILYVENQSQSKYFYEQLLEIKPKLDVPGMTEFLLRDFVKLGLMPEEGIAKILKDKIPHPKKANGVPRCELYLIVEKADSYIHKGVQLGGTLISELETRNWGDKVGYISDLDGHIIAFAEKD
ncbi:hypothetical protein ACFLSE_05105 [Bacteroidota bacterium]